MEAGGIPFDKEEFNRRRRENLGRLLVRVFDAFEDGVLEAYRARGIHQLQRTYLPVLRSLDLEGNRITELAERAGLSKQTVGPLVRELAEKGIVRVVPDPTDGRAKVVQWTDAGLQGLAVGLEILDEVSGQFTRVIGEGRMEGLRATLILLLDAFERPR